MSVKKILVVAPECPVPPDDGHKLRVLNLIKGISDPIRVTWLFFGKETKDESGTAECRMLGDNCTRVITVDKNTLNPFVLQRNIIKNIFYPHELTIEKPVFSSVMSARVTKEIASLQYDFVFFSGFKMFLYADREVLSQVPYLVDVIDSPSALLHSYFRLAKRLPEKVKTFVNWYWARRYEIIHFSKCKNIVFVSSVDADTVKKVCPLSHVCTISNGVDIDFFKPERLKEPIPGALLFTGVMSYKPNNDAMVFFLNSIFPLIRERIEQAQLIIAGRDPLPELLDLARKSSQVYVTGYVQDMRKEFNKAEVYISPLTSGAGLKNKILEAWAMQLPVVATKMSCAGIDIKNGINLLVADNPSAFAEQVTRLLLNNAERQELAKQGRETVEQLYSWKAKSRDLFSCVNKACGID